MVKSLLNHMEEGYSVGMYLGRKYGITKTLFNNGQSVKLYAEELGGTDFVSLNYYSTSKKEILRPCEMPADKVIDFLKKVELVSSEGNGYV
ncbi:peptide methionine sulfoxide reductase [Arcticibacterium luteifluviistationis]|uniref:Peptide methionine sulfoxide reductase n=1 Tax=Arcticibacterium luteifluviistationis TaxID=1784714 RepID=A0A2Z4GD13_9BACT|nr:peptide methionine sulfoxide reductase [Arcticibacterium luteifluviistationis]AWV98793.1 peptide methionine sulfoxide reductase [Arcticibacterium luteifluviistationis]